MLYFLDNSTAGSALIGVADNSSLYFLDNSTAGSATLRTNGGFISFEGSSRGGTAQIELADIFINGSGLDIDHDVTIGSLAVTFRGEDSPGIFVFLGANNLTVGSNNLSTTFSGEILGTGALTKIGSGTLILSGANTYTGNTNVSRGVLQVDGSITGNTFVNHRGTLAGSGTINGNVTNNGSVSPGGALGAPGGLTVVHD
jgi:autotransporter-associated beta strand protein